MALTRFLASDEMPPAGERFLLVVPRERKGVKVIRHDDPAQRRPSYTYQVGPDKWAFWCAEGPLLADRLRLGRVYFRREMHVPSAPQPSPRNGPRERSGHPLPLARLDPNRRSGERHAKGLE